MIFLEPIAKLESVPLRLAWTHEAQSFTRWLADNLHRLSAAVGIPLTALEAKVVAERQIADILARDERDGSIVVIENQLEAANDAHLGRILGYVAAVDAGAVIWIAERFSEALLSAVRWLNGKRAIHFFAVQLRVVRIASSELACTFEVVERPNSWERELLAAGTEAKRVGGFAGGFWASHLARFPSEERMSRPVGPRCRWRATQPTGLVIGQLVHEHSAAVFLRGRHGVTLQAAEALLSPYAGDLELRLSMSLDAGRPALLAMKTLEVNVSDPANWPEISEWLWREANAYDAALRALCSKTPTPRGKSRSKLQFPSMASLEG